MSAVVDRLLTDYEGGRISRRDLVLSLTTLVAATAAGAQQEKPPIAVRSLNHVTMFVPDVESAVTFYRGTLGLKVLSRQAGGTNLAAGPDGQFVGIFGRRSEAASIHHFCLGVEDFDHERIVAALAERDVEARVRMREDTTPEVYFQDLNGLSVQLQDVGYCGGGGPLGNDCEEARR